MPNAIPEGYHSITPYLASRDTSKAIEFYREALGAKELCRIPMPDGKIAHAELMIGNSRLMLSDESPEWGNQSARSLGGTPIVLFMYTENVDALGATFVKAGGKVVRPIQNQFYGDRSGVFEDPDGYQWSLSQHIEDVSPEELERRMSTMT